MNITNSSSSSSATNKRASHHHHSNSKKGGRWGCCFCSLPTLLAMIITAVLSFYSGLLVGMRGNGNGSSGGGAGALLLQMPGPATATTTTATAESAALVERAIQERVEQELNRRQRSVEAEASQHRGGGGAAAAVGVGVGDDTAPRFPPTVHDFAVGLSAVDRDDFARAFRLGVPLDESTPQNRQVLIVYQSAAALPTTDPYAAAEAAASHTSLPSIPSVTAAVENCDYVNLILTEHSPKLRRQCTAIMGQYEAFHIQKYMRLPPDGPLDPAMPLRFVNRGAQSNGRKSTKPPAPDKTLAYWAILQRYLSNFEASLLELQPILQRAAIDNTVTILVCNFGQSELLLNFVCAARQRALDVSHLVVFATDADTRDLCVGLGVAVYYDVTNYGDMPHQAAARYADQTFTAMMMAKVFCVHVTTWLGYDVLFQDVDVIWYRDPVPYFHNIDAADRDYDIYFQDEYVHTHVHAKMKTSPRAYSSAHTHTHALL